jgi:hypothetical protein
MYSIDLKKISVKEFTEILHSIDLLPGRRILLNHIDRIANELEKEGNKSLYDLQKVLRKKTDYDKLAVKYSVTEEYITILNREINSYESKPIDIEKLSIFSPKELTILNTNKIKTTADLYMICLGKKTRNEISVKMSIDERKIYNALELIDLLRVNGIGPVYAKILNEIGIKSINDYLKTKSEDILVKYQKINAEKGYSKAKLGLKDIEYCKRFCKKLKKEIEW